MKIQILNDLNIEIERLFIAGSKFAKGDPRISKYIPTLNKMGEKAPIMKKLAEKIEALVSADQNDSMNALAEAGTFLYAVLAVQGSITLDGEEAGYQGELNAFPETKLPYSQIRPIIEALTMSKPGRLEVIQTAYESGLLGDFRLYEYLTDALDDKYTEIPELLQKQIIPSLGDAIIPYLLEKYDNKGGKSNTRRLALLHKLGYAHIQDLANKAIEHSDPQLAAEGIKILGDDPKNEEYLLTLSKDKKSVIREAALTALIRLDSPKGKEMMLDCLNSSKYRPAIEAARECSDAAYTIKILRIVKGYHENIINMKPDDKSFTDAEESFNEITAVLEHKSDKEVLEFYIMLFKESPYIASEKVNKAASYNRNNIVSNISHYLHALNSTEALSVFEQICNTKIAARYRIVLENYFNIALSFYDKEKLYQVFSPYYCAGILNSSQIYGDYYNEKTVNNMKNILHVKWLKLFKLKKDAFALVVQLDEESIKTKEGIKQKKDIIDILKKTEHRTRKHSERTAVYRLLEICDESEKETLQKILTT